MLLIFKSNILLAVLPSGIVSVKSTENSSAGKIEGITASLKIFTQMQSVLVYH